MLGLLYDNGMGKGAFPQKVRLWESKNKTFGGILPENACLY